LFFVVGARGRGLAGVLNRIATEQEMRGEAIAGGQAKDNLCHLNWIAVFPAQASR
jgi:hypothetical protein